MKLTVSHETEVQAAQKSFQLARQLQAALSPNALLLGPTPSAIMRIKNRYYYQIIIKYKNEPALKPLLEQILDESQIDQKKGLYVSIDNEPLNFI